MRKLVNVIAKDYIFMDTGSGINVAPLSVSPESKIKQGSKTQAVTCDLHEDTTLWKQARANVAWSD